MFLIAFLYDYDVDFFSVGFLKPLLVFLRWVYQVSDAVPEKSQAHQMFYGTLMEYGFRADRNKVGVMNIRLKILEACAGVCGSPQEPCSGG